MKKRTISKLIHVIAILTFAFPFFYTGCGTSKDNAKEQAKMDSLRADSIAKANKDTAKIDTAVKITTSEDAMRKENIDTASIKPNKIDNNASTRKSENNDDKKQLTDEVVKKYPFLSFVLMPESEIYSGFGVVLNDIPYVFFVFLFFTFLLLIIGLLIKFIDPHALKSIVIIDVMMFLGTLISRSPSWNCEKLWGYWVCLSVVGVLLIYDVYILIVKLKQKS